MDDFVPVDRIKEHEGYTSGSAAADHLGAMDPNSDDSRRVMYGNQWRRILPEANFRYGKPLAAHPDHFASAPGVYESEGFQTGTGEKGFHALNTGKIGVHLLGPDDKLVPSAASKIARRRGLYVRGVRNNVQMAHQGEDDRFSEDHVGHLAKGPVNRDLTWGKMRRYAGDKQMGFGDQQVPLDQAALQVWGGGKWVGQHTQHLADFLVGQSDGMKV
mmetsp:Transcript_64854/g.155017  ORF Transcript_64854/g.155017 Transcript_64854/m.155017 type:complete len:216 (-) Transcript_64854:2-649(-)